jgi:hypothetical protein
VGSGQWEAGSGKREAGTGSEKRELEMTGLKWRAGKREAGSGNDESEMMNWELANREWRTGNSELA